jgi:hypothetical protein
VNPKILILGMHRSGTTLLGDLVGKHPAVRRMFHEAVLMRFSRDELYAARTLPDHRMVQTRGELVRARNAEPVEWVVDFDLARETWGAKMSYPGPVILQTWCDRTDRYLRRWQETFGGEARVVHVVRHPFDVFVSARRRWARDPGHLSNYGAVTLDAVCRDWAHSLDALLPVIDADPRSICVRFEDLVESPGRVLPDVFRRCDLAEPDLTAAAALESDVVFFGTVDASRSLRHRSEPLEPISRSTAFLLRGFFERFGYGDDGRP